MVEGQRGGRRWNFGRVRHAWARSPNTGTPSLPSEVIAIETRSLSSRSRHSSASLFRVSTSSACAHSPKINSHSDPNLNLSPIPSPESSPISIVTLKPKYTLRPK